jgi:hypothetical protein
MMIAGECGPSSNAGIGNAANQEILKGTIYLFLKICVLIRSILTVIPLDRCAH